MKNTTMLLIHKNVIMLYKQQRGQTNPDIVGEKKHSSSLEQVGVQTLHDHFIPYSHNRNTLRQRTCIDMVNSILVKTKKKK